MVVDVQALNAEEWPDLSRMTNGTVSGTGTRCDVVVNPNKARHREHRYYQLEVWSVLQLSPDVLRRQGDVQHHWYVLWRME